MSEFLPFEAEIVRVLCEKALDAEVLELVLREATLVELDYTGHGYCLTVRHEGLPVERVVCHVPSVSGSAEGILCGFLVFIEENELMLECHGYGDLIEMGFRDKAIALEFG